MPNLVYLRRTISGFLWILEYMVFFVMFVYSCCSCFDKTKNTFLCVAYGQYQKKYFEHIFFIKKTIFEVLKMCFRMDFLNIKKYFLAFWIVQHVCKTPKGVGQYSKNIKILFLENSSLFTINIWIKKPQRD